MPLFLIAVPSLVVMITSWSLHILENVVDENFQEVIFGGIPSIESRIGS